MVEGVESGALETGDTAHNAIRYGLLVLYSYAAEESMEITNVDHANHTATYGPCQM